MKIINNVLLTTALLSSTALAQEVAIIDSADAGGFQSIEFEVVDSQVAIDDLTTEFDTPNLTKLSQTNYNLLADELKGYSSSDIGPSASWLEKETGYHDFETGESVLLGDLFNENCLCIDENGNKVLVVQSLDDVNQLENEKFFNGQDNADYIEGLAEQHSALKSGEGLAAFVLQDESKQDTVPIAVISKTGMMSLFNGLEDESDSGKLNEYTTGAMLYNIIQHELFHSTDYIAHDANQMDKAFIETKAEAVGFFESSKQIIKDGMLSELQNYTDVYNAYVSSLDFYTESQQDLFKDMGAMYSAVDKNDEALLGNIQDPQIAQFTKSILDGGVDENTVSRLAQGVNSLKSPYLFATASAEIVEQLIAEPELLAEMDDDSVTEMSIKVASKIIESQENSDYFNIEYTQNVPENVTIGFDLEMDGYEYDEVARHRFN